MCDFQVASSLAERLRCLVVVSLASDHLTHEVPGLAARNRYDAHQFILSVPGGIYIVLLDRNLFYLGCHGCLF